MTAPEPPAVPVAVAAAQAPESPTDSTPKAARWGSGEAETATGTVQAPDVAALSDALALIDRLMPVLLPGEDWSRGVSWRADRAESFQRERDRLRALLGTDTTPAVKR